MSTDDEIIRTPEGRQALGEVLHRMWEAGGGDPLRWYAVYDHDDDPNGGDSLQAICRNQEVADLLIERSSVGPLEVRELTCDQTIEALENEHRERVRLATFYGQNLRSGDLPKDIPNKESN